jgi:membrane-bound lytic murein transglycosylase B
MYRFGMAVSPLITSAVMLGLVTSCANGPQLPNGLPDIGLPSPPGAPTETGPIAYKTSGHAEMNAWRTDFSARLLSAGHDRTIVRSLLADIKPLDIWLGAPVKAESSAENQAEFTKPIWEYLKVPLGASRVSNGQARLASLAPTFDALEARYGVDRAALISIWGMETSYGAVIGNFDAANALANMAVEGRRRKFAEGEIIALVKMIDRGDAARNDLVAGWAGAMGHTQFMPSTYLAYAQDFNGDGRKDVWKTEADALASAANYLKASGYAKDQPWGVEVLLPSGFDYALADGQERRLASWTAAGVSPISGGAFNTNGADFSELWLPAGAQGPKFLLFNNFKVFKTYNRADSYALAVGLAGDVIAGKPGVVAAWPTHLTPLRLGEIRALQAGLNARGFDAGTVDGIAGRRTKLALQAFQKSKGVLADGYPTTEMLALVTGKAATTSVVTSAAPGGQ